MCSTRFTNLDQLVISAPRQSDSLPSRIGRAPRFRILGLATLLLAALPAAAGDMARYMPTETALYVGWSSWVAKDDPALRWQHSAARAAAQALADDAGDDHDSAAFAQTLLEILPLLQTGSAGLGLFDVTHVDHQLDVQAALLVSAPEAERLNAALHEIAVALAGPDNVERRAVRDVALERVQLGSSPLHLLWGMHKDHWLLALGDTAAAKVIDCLDGKTPALADAPELKFVRGKVAAGTDRHICCYVDVARIIARGKELARENLGELPAFVDPALQELGLTAIKSKYLHFDRRDGQPRIMAFAHLDGPRTGILKVWDQQPLSDDDLRIVPKNAYWAEVVNLDLADLWQEALRIIESLAPEQLPAVQGTLAMASAMTGLQLPDGVLNLLGDTWALFDAPDHGGILFSGTVLVADVKDPNGLQNVLTRCVQFAAAFAQEQNIKVKIEQLTRGGHQINCVLIGGVPAPVAPAWAFLDGRVVMAAYPQTVAAALKQLDPKTRSESLLDHPGFRAARAKLPPNAQGIGYYDSQYFARLLYPFLTALQTMGVSAAARYELKLDLDAFPPLPEWIADVTSFVGTSSADSDGILYASVGHGAPLSLTVGGAALATSIVIPSVSRAREITKRAISAANLRSLGLACQVYAHDHGGRFPDRLERLVEDGLTTPDALHSPRDPDDDETRVSFEYIAGQDQSADPRNVLAYEPPRDDEGTNLLFVDGHAEWMSIDKALQAIQETYRRLGRADDAPARLGE